MSVSTSGFAVADERMEIVFGVSDALIAGSVTAHTPPSHEAVIGGAESTVTVTVALERSVPQSRTAVSCGSTIEDANIDGMSSDIVKTNMLVKTRHLRDFIERWNTASLF
jgi:hypothetical protein